MKIKTGTSCLVLTALIACCAVSVAGLKIRAKRQTQPEPRAKNQDGPKMVSRAISASAASMASSNGVDEQLPSLRAKPSVDFGGASGQSRPVRPMMRPPTNAPADANLGFNQDDDEGPEMAPAAPRRKRPPTRQRTRPDRYHEEHDEDEECDDDDGHHHHHQDHDHDYDNMFGAAFRPMRQMGDMMGNMFEHMQSLASGDFENVAADGNYAVASAQSDGSGYSRQSSIVSNNGKRRGIISETRNGRTQTRRIGDSDEE